jgi:hypothetical protein
MFDTIRFAFTVVYYIIVLIVSACILGVVLARLIYQVTANLVNWYYGPSLPKEATA